jgi:DNA-binding NarL/FixJ family response regulator
MSNSPPPRHQNARQARPSKFGYKTGMTISVSVVEDDAQTREILARWINAEPGFRLRGDWGDAESAMALLPEHEPDVVLMDINLPGMSGVDAVRRLKLLLPATQFVMLTVYEDVDHIYNALSSGATGYLLKQTPRETLLTALQDIHRGGSPMSCKIARRVVQSFWAPPMPMMAGNELSRREQEVLEHLARGFLYKEIAAELNLSVPTINTYVRRIYEKLHVRSRGQAIARFAGLEQDPPPPNAART